MHEGRKWFGVNMVPLTEFSTVSCFCLAQLEVGIRHEATQDSSGDAPSVRFHRGMGVFVQMWYGRTLLERFDGEFRSLEKAIEGTDRPDRQLQSAVQVEFLRH